MRRAVGCWRADCVVHNLTSCLNSLSANLLVLHSTLLMLNRLALLFEDSLTLLLPLSGTHLLLVSVADMLVYSCALLFLGWLTMLFRDSTTNGVGDNCACTLLYSGTDILMSCIAFLFWYIMTMFLIFWVALFVADRMTFLLVSC